MQFANARRVTHWFAPSQLLPGTVAIFTTLLLVTGCNGDDDDAAPTIAKSAQINARSDMGRTPIAEYNIVAVNTRRIPTTVPLGGTVIPRLEITVSAEAPGKILYLAGPEGTKVRRGELLVGLDDTALRAKNRAGWANLAQTSAALQNANVQLESQLYGGGFSPQGGMGLPSLMDKFMTEPMASAAGVGNPALKRIAQVNQSRTSVELAQAAVLAAQAGLDELEAALSDTRSLSPGPAVILEKFVEMGDSVQPGQPMLRIADTNDLLVKVELPTSLLMGLEQGMTIPIQIDATKIRIHAVLEQIYPSADPQRQTVTIKLALPAGAAAAPGMYSTVMIPELSTQPETLPVIPSSAIVWRGSQPFVFIVSSNNQSEMRLVRIGDYLDGTVVILSGIAEGERIVSTPPPMMRSGIIIGAVAG